MCIISILPKGTEKLTDKTINFITNGFYNNTDGSGFMCKKEDNKLIYISKGYNSLDLLINDIKSLNLGLNDELVIHHRIGNVGKVDEVNCHPFECSYIEKVINNWNGHYASNPCMVHNGTFTEMYAFRQGYFDYSDTYAFARFIMSNTHVQNMLKTTPILFTELLKPYINTSKLCFLFPDRDLIKIGNFIEEDGYYHSNLGYKDGYYRDVGGTFRKAEPQKALPQGKDNDKVATTKVSLENRINAILKRGILNLGGDFVTIDEFNHKDFIFMTYDEYSPNSFELFKFNSYDSLAVLNVLAGSHTNVAVNEQSLAKEYKYCVHNSVASYYKEYLVLLRDLEPSKKVLKKLYAQLNNSRRKTDDFKIFHNRLGAYFTRYSLILYFNRFKEYYLCGPELEMKNIRVVEEEQTVVFDNTKDCCTTGEDVDEMIASAANPTYDNVKMFEHIND